MKGPGGRFEAEIQASIPRKSRGGRAVSIEKRHDPPTRGTGGRCRRCNGRLMTICSACRIAPKGAARFTARQPFDLEVICPTTSRFEGAAGPVVLSVVFAFECKRTAGPSLPFSALRAHQRAGLARVAAAGGVAGALWLYEPPPEKEIAPRCWFIPIAAFLDYGANQALGGRKSWGISTSLEVSGAVPEVKIDPDRGRTRRYWRMDDLLRRFGADV